MRIVTDSTADLSAEEYETQDICVVPLTIRLGERTWRDFFDIDPDTYYALLRESKDFPVTSQPSPRISSMPTRLLWRKGSRYSRSRYPPS